MSGNGYMEDYSMSRNAAAEYEAGASTFSNIDAAWIENHEIPCSLATLKDLIYLGEVRSSAWHHTGTHFNTSFFYRPDSVREQVEKFTEAELKELRASARERRAKARAERRAAADAYYWIEGEKVTFKGGPRYGWKVDQKYPVIGVVKGAWMYLDDGSRHKPAVSSVTWERVEGVPTTDDVDRVLRLAGIQQSGVAA